MSRVTYSGPGAIASYSASGLPGLLLQQRHRARGALPTGGGDLGGRARLPYGQRQRGTFGPGRPAEFFWMRTRSNMA
ncbi:hypothetical protein ACIPC1_15970 [Streptomyces sp. NPDC087263]|uniref:hypothetical protein n=1 Tax=Streptomyces sp. NPDC087263 TaxID=3365773 RepID=UPI0038052B90